MTWLSVREMIDRIVLACDERAVVCASPNTPSALIDRFGPRMNLHHDPQRPFDLLLLCAVDASETGEVLMPSQWVLPLLPVRALAWIAPAPAMLFGPPVHGSSIKVQQVLFEGGLIDVTPNGLLLREVPTGISARQVQARSHATLWADRELQVVAR